MIDCYEKAKQKFPWWPDWRGQDVLAIASGHSAKLYRPQWRGNIKVAVIRASVDLCPNADLLYAADEDWWNYASGLPWFEGLKITNARNAANKWKLNRIEIKPNHDRLVLNDPGVVGSGGCSGFHLFNLLITFGVKKIILLGYDMGQKHHWYGKNKWPGSSNPSEKNFDRWRKALDDNAAEAKRIQVEVINAGGNESTLTQFPKMNLEQALC